MLLKVVRDRFTELLVDCGLGFITLAVVFYTLLTLFRRNRKNDDAAGGEHDEPKF